MIRAELDIQISLATHQSLQLQHTLSRHDDLLLVNLAVHLRLTQRQPMTVCGNGSQMTTTGFQQHAIQVVANILLRHGEMRLLD